MLPRVTERFEDWLHAPIEYRSRDPRVVQRRLERSDFAATYDLVDAAFGVARPRASYEWLYERNPRGLARCVGAFEIRSGRCVAVSVEWPWPAAHRATARPGIITGDRATAPDWQRQGLYGIFKDFRIAHPWRGMRISWPNALSRHAMSRAGRSDEIIGPLTRAVVVLDPLRLLARRGVPEPFARPLARVATVTQAGWERLRLGRDYTVHVAAVDRFDARFDAVTAAATREWSGYWCPHDADFLNWRYLDHPAHEYAALAVGVGEGVAGYAVVRLSGGVALLMELVTDPAAPTAAGPLLRAMLARAREAGCDRLEAMAPSRWRHWRLLHQFGAIERPCEVMMQFDEPAQLDERSMDRWLLSPGDFDAA